MTAVATRGILKVDPWVLKLNPCDNIVILMVTRFSDRLWRGAMHTEMVQSDTVHGRDGPTLDEVGRFLGLESVALKT